MKVFGDDGEITLAWLGAALAIPAPTKDLVNMVDAIFICD